ncbi:alcohol dehydrogenase [Phialemonium atrogriseum]|uniref:Alcohol dehydrogenase n=1 Tax=Phialemonium atrogriseum TaxID=1093897 RepID=A0AAJ0C031_9PEZI|nr:alcohol dehydrogenase [Phialemonium atrogriseum]KAK1766608.1 alcohol dehydrogenase [Phialemonium atrogriseum]
MTTNQSSQPLPTTQKAAILVNPGPDFSFEIRNDVPVQPLGARDVLVSIEVTGICGTDLGLACGALGPCSTILGHEGVGRVVAVGSDVSAATAASLGRRVAVAWIRDCCGACAVCMRGEGETRCLGRVFGGMAVPGTLAETAVVPERYLCPLPDDLEPEVMAPIVCGGVTAYKAIKTCEAVPGSWILVSGGAGGVGGLAVQFASAMGYRVIAVDGGEEGGKRSLAAGAEKYIDFQKDKDIKEAVLRETGGQLCAAAIVCVGASSAYEAALPCLDHFGVLVCVGIPPGGAQVSFHPITLIDLGIKIKASLVGSRGDILEALEFVRRGLVKPRVFSIAMEELNQYVRKVAEVDGKLLVRVRE